LNSGQHANHFLYSSPSEGRAFAWGSGTSGELGVGAAADSDSAIFVNTLISGVVDSCAGAAHSVFVDALGAVWTTGRNDNGQLGDGGNTHRDTVRRLALDHFSGKPHQTH
jgi:alpha-tubulin suppressor-like RCC1 family protein